MLNAVVKQSIFFGCDREKTSIQMSMYLALMSNYRLSKAVFENYEVKYPSLALFISNTNVRDQDDEDPGLVSTKLTNLDSITATIDKIARDSLPNKAPTKTMQSILQESNLLMIQETHESDKEETPYDESLPLKTDCSEGPARQQIQLPRPTFGVIDQFLKYVKITPKGYRFEEKSDLRFLTANPDTYWEADKIILVPDELLVEDF
jgi:hypothetical protein